MSKIPQKIFDYQRDSIITEDVRILGDVESSDAITLEGTIIGNIKTTKNVETFIASYIEGNVQANSANLGGKINGSVECEQNISIDQNTVINGNLSSNIIIIAGKVTGNIYASHSVKLKENAFVHGNITCSIISIEEGARIDGNLKMLIKEVLVEEDEASVDEFSDTEAPIL